MALLIPILVYKINEKLVRYIQASKLTTDGLVLQQLSKLHARHIPGYFMRVILLGLSIALNIILCVSLYNSIWIPVVSQEEASQCILATYSNHTIRNHLDSYLLGKIDTSLINTFSIPLQDGLLGGWSAWPLARPDTAFTTSAMGIGYALETACYKPKPTTKSLNGTYYNLTSIHVVENYATGDIQIYHPPSTLMNSKSTEFNTSYTSNCFFKIGFGEAETEYSFISDVWGKTVTAQLHALRMAGTRATQQDMHLFASDFYDGLKPDSYGFSSRFAETLEYLYANKTLVFQAGHTTQLSWAALPDGYYHESILWKGLAGSLGVVAHQLLMQYETTLGTCSYQALNVKGSVSVDMHLIDILLYFIYILAGGLLLQTIWAYLSFPGGKAGDIACLSLENPCRMALEMLDFGAEIFGGFSSSFSTLNYDIYRSCGDQTLVYGCAVDWVDSPQPKLCYGPIEKVVPLSKLVSYRKAQKTFLNPNLVV